MGKYAADTSVSVARSKAEIEETIERYGGSAFAFMSEVGEAKIAFRMGDRNVQFTLPLPKRDDEAFTLTLSRKWERDPTQALAAWEKACRQRWRALALVIKANLEAIECGIVLFDDVFLAHIVTPDGDTIGQKLAPQMRSLSIGMMPRFQLTAGRIDNGVTG